MSRQLLAISATLLLVSACADPEAGEPIYVIVLPDAAPDEDQPAAPDMADALDQDAPDLDAPDQGAPDQAPPEDMASPPDMEAPDQGQADMPPADANPCASGLTDQARVDAWLDERIDPQRHQLATGATGTLTTSAHVITFDRYNLTITRRADSAVLLDCDLPNTPSITPGASPTCQLVCTGPLGAGLSTSLTSRAVIARAQSCSFTGLGVEPPALSFAISHLDYESWVWTLDLTAERVNQAARNVGTVFIKYFEHRGQCLRLWHTQAKLVGSPIIPTVDGPRFKMFDIRQGLWLPRLDADVSEEEFFQAAASRVELGD